MSETQSDGPTVEVRPGVEEDNHPDLQDGPVPPKDTPLGRLLDLTKDLSPFLDSQGRAFCYAKSDGGGPGAITSLDGEVTHSLLNYRYFVAHGELPARSEVSRALILACGELWHKRPPQAALRPQWAATIGAIVKSVEIDGDFLGTATEAMKLLKKVGRTDPAISTNLPKKDGQMGIVLSRIGLLLRSYDIELFRPPRRDKARLWCWRLLTPGHDTPDRLSSQVSGITEGLHEGENDSDDTSDALSHQLRTLVQIHQGALE